MEETKSVFKYMTNDEERIFEIPENFKKIFFGSQDGIPCLWAELDPNAPKKKYWFKKIEVSPGKEGTLIELPKGSICIGGTREQNPSIRFYLTFMVPGHATETETYTYICRGTGSELVNSATHVAIIFNNDMTKDNVDHVYRLD